LQKTQRGWGVQNETQLKNQIGSCKETSECIGKAKSWGERQRGHMCKLWEGCRKKKARLMGSGACEGKNKNPGTTKLLNVPIPSRGSLLTKHQVCRGQLASEQIHGDRFLGESRYHGLCCRGWVTGHRGFTKKKKRARTGGGRGLRFRGLR